MTGNRSASILARLLTLAKQRGDDYSLLLNRFGMERLLARVSMFAAHTHTAPWTRISDARCRIDHPFVQRKGP